MANVLFKIGTAAQYAALDPKVDTSFYLTSDTKELYIGSKKITNHEELEAALTTLNGDAETLGSIRNYIASAISGLDTINDVTIASESSGVVTLKAGVKEVDGVIAQGTGSDITLDKVATTGAAEDVDYDNTTSGLAATDVQAAIDEVAAASAGGVGSKTVYITEISGQSSDPFSKRYGIYQGANGSSASPVVGEKLVDIDIPKDMVVESGSVGTVTTADVPYIGAQVGDKYIDLVIANATSDHIYIPANSLVDVYTAQQSATQIQLAIDANNVISATVVAGSIGATELASDAVTTAKITDGNVTFDKLASAVQTSLGLADSAVQSVTESDATTGTNGTITVDGTEVAVKGLGTAAFTDSTAYDAAGAAASAAAAAVEALDLTEAPLAEVSSNVVTIHGISQADGQVAVGVNSANDVVLEEVAYTGAAADVSIADAGGYTSQTTVEAALQEIYGQLTWQSIS